MAQQAFLGIDIGTSTTKAALVSQSGHVLGSSSSGYDILIPSPGAAEQDPETWWRAVVSAANGVVSGVHEAVDIAAVGLTGQMHSAVFIDDEGMPLRPAILWADKRATRQADLIFEKLADPALRRIVRNPVPPGFTAPSILRVRDNEPEIYDRTAAVIQPKDYIALRLTGQIGTDVTDASATGLFDIVGGTWSTQMLAALGIPSRILPAIHPSGTAAGTVTPRAAAELSLEPSVPVIWGGGDQPVQAVGNGIVRPGTASLTIGTGGQVFLPVSDIGDAGTERRPAIHAFCHSVPGLFYLMGATLAAGLSLKWFRDNFARGVSFAELDREAGSVAPGADGLVFLPYLMGERTPHMDPHARGLFCGIDLGHGRGHFARAVMEGVAFSLREAAEAVARVSQMPGELVMTGGGAHSGIWPGIIADVLGVPVRFPAVDEGAAYGAALLAAVGGGFFSDIHEAVGEWVRYREGRVTPREETRKLYDGIYDRYREAYRRLGADGP